MNSLYIIEKLNRKYGAWLFYTALVLFLVSFSWFWISDVPRQILRIRELLVTVSQVLFLLRIGLLSWKYRGFVLLCAVILFLFYLSSHLSHSSIIKNTALVIAASRDEDKKKVLRIYLLAFLLVLMTAPITCAMGWTGDITKHKYELTGHSWGFFNPNRLAYFLQMFVFLGFVYLRIKKTWVVWAISYTAAAVIGWTTLSMTSVAIMLLFPPLYYFLKHHSISPVWFAFIPVFLTLLSLAFSLYFGPSTGDTTFESRFSIPYQIFKQQDISLLGQDCGIISWVDAIKKNIDPYYMNNMFLDLIIRHGVITTLITIAFYSHFLYRMGRINHPQILAMSTCLAFSGLMQLFPLYIALNFLLLYYFHQPFPLKGRRCKE